MYYTTLLTEIAALLFGRKYWANVMRRKGTAEVSLSCYIFPSRREADAHRLRLETNASFEYVETVSFRSRTLEDALSLTSISLLP